jgi:hypothetical protein
MVYERSSTPEFGTGHFVGYIMADPEAFFELPVRDQARVVGRANGCPVVGELTDPENTAPGRGPEAMLRRYSEVNFWFGYICSTVAEVNPDLKRDLTTPAPRLPGERAGKFEVDSVPLTHLGEMAPMGTLAGYALPRLFVEQLGTNRGLSRAEVGQRLSRGLEVLRESALEARTPLELLALMAEGLTTPDGGHTTPDQAFKHIFSQGWLGEHNAHSMMAECKRVMAEKAPTLWAKYQALTPAQKSTQNLA